MIFDSNNTKLQRGIFLIEVLIATVVVGVGLMSLASLQGGLMLSSGESKARSEAIMLAEAKQEGLRNNIIKTTAITGKSSFDGDLAVISDGDRINGINATFDRHWDISDTPSAPYRKIISVKVTWGAGGANETVNMVSEVVWSDPGKTIDYATGGNGLSGKVQSPNNNSSSVDATQFTPAQIASATALNDGSNLKKYDDGMGHTYLLNGAGTAVIKFNGGVSQTIKGRVFRGDYTKAKGAAITPLIEHPVTFSDLAYCVFPVTFGQSDYICYFGGDCSHGGSGCSTTNPTLPYTAVSGGWYGKVGLVETSTASFQNEKVCFAEDIASDVALTAVTTARSYSSQRMDSNNTVVGLEGINESFACQDFLLVSANGKSNDCHYFRKMTGLSVPSSDIRRTLAYNVNNVSLAENTSNCGTTVAYRIIGSITGDLANNVSVYVNSNSCIIVSNSSGYSYDCSITTSNTTLTITANGGNVTPPSTPIISPAPGINTGPTLVASTPLPTSMRYTITGQISGNSANQATVSLNGTACEKPLLNIDGTSYTYICKINSTPTTGYITATGGNVVFATGYTSGVSLADVADMAGPNFVATTVITSMYYTIRGNVTGSYANSVSFSMLSGGICNNNGDGTYTCLLNAVVGPVTISATKGNVSPASDTVNLAGISAVTGPTFNADNLTVCAVKVTGSMILGIDNGAKALNNSQVTVNYSTSSPVSNNISCTKSSTTNGTYTYSCSSAGNLANNSYVTIGGNNVTSSSPNPITVLCASNSLTITGPNVTTTK